MKLAQRYHGWPTCAVLQPPRQYHAAEHQAHTRRACRHKPACEVLRVRRALIGRRPGVQSPFVQASSGGVPPDALAASVPQLDRACGAA